MGDWRTIRDRIRARHLLAIGIVIAVVMSEISLTIQPRWRTREARHTVEQIDRIDERLSQLLDRMTALETTDAESFRLLAQSVTMSGRVSEPAARRQRALLQERLDEIARQQRVLIERYRAR